MLTSNSIGIKRQAVRVAFTLISIYNVKQKMSFFNAKIMLACILFTSFGEIVEIISTLMFTDQPHSLSL